MRKSYFHAAYILASGAVIGSYSEVSRAATCPVLDEFTFPATPRTTVLWGDRDAEPTTGIALLHDASPTILGGYRDTAFDIYDGNPTRGIAALALGSFGPTRSQLSVAQGAAVIAELQLNYGAFTRPPSSPYGPLMGVDLSACRGMKVDFTAVEASLNFVVVYYTSKPVTPNVYYMQNAMNVTPSTPGAALSFVLDFGSAPFNWNRVDGIAVVINRSGPIPGSAYTLDRLTFVPR